MEYVCVDLGASNTRYRSQLTKGDMPNFLENNMVFLDSQPEDVDLVPYDGSVESALEAVITKVDGASDFFPKHVLVGSLAERYNSVNERPSGDTHKHKQATTYVSAVMVAALSRIKEGVGEDVVMYVALPPVEVKTAKAKVIEQMVGRYSVKFPKFNGGTNVAVNIVAVNCYEEAYMAFASYLFDLSGALRPEAKDMMTGCVVSVDIGDSTTDLAIVKNGQYLDKSGQTYKVGASIARAALCDSVRAEYGFDLPIEDANRTMCEGRLQLGAEYVEIPDMIRAAKNVLAQMIVEHIKNYFRLQNMPIQTLKGAVVSGGGSLASGYVDASGKEVVVVEPMSSYITAYMKDVCPGLKVVPYGENARIANINGLALKARVDSVNNARMAEKGMSADK